MDHLNVQPVYFNKGTQPVQEGQVQQVQDTKLYWSYESKCIILLWI